MRNSKAYDLSARAQSWTPVIDYRLLDRLSQEATPCSESKGFRTAFGTRLVALSWAFHQEQLADEVIESYLCELVAACERQAAIIEGVQDLENERDAILAFLDGIIDLSDELDAIDTEPLRDSVLELEADLALAYISLNLGVAA